MKPGTPVVVEWEDHAFFFGEWSRQKTVAPTKTLGFFVDEDDDIVAVSLSYNIQEGTYQEVQVIDKRMVKSIRRVR